MTETTTTEKPRGTLYKTIICDPPWTGQGVEKLYDTMSQRRLEQLPIADLTAPNAHLWLWATNGTLDRAMALAEKWGFRYRGLITWAKGRPSRPTVYLMPTTELLILATRGSGPEIEAVHRGQGTFFMAPPTISSAKPDEVWAIVRRVSRPPYAELFSRCRSILGGDHWGNQVDSDFTIDGFPVPSDFARQGTDPRSAA